MTPATFPPKNPNEVDWRNFDFAARLARYNDTIATATVAIEPGTDGALTIDQVANANGIVSFRWSAGTPGTLYTIRCVVTTTGGRTWEQSATVRIERT